MICFVAGKRDITETISRIGESYPTLATNVRFIEYSQLLSMETLPTGTYVFTDTLAMYPPRRELAMLVERQMLEHHNKFRILNPPSLAPQMADGLDGKPLSQVNLHSIELPLVARNCTFAAERSTEIEGQENLSLYLAEMILNGIDSDRIMLAPPRDLVSIALHYGGRCIDLGKPSSLSAEIVAKGGLDVFCLATAEQNGKDYVQAVTNRLTDILPSAKRHAPLCQEVTEAILALDTVAPADPIPLGLGWESLARAMKLTSPS
jgi:hypothetical protein